MNNETTTTVLLPLKTLEEAIRDQSRTGGWVCPRCRNHKGGVACKMNVFIAFTGAYTKNCFAFDPLVEIATEA